MKTIKEILMRRDGLTEEQAEVLIEKASDQLREYLMRGDIGSAYFICEEYFGLEPDYVDHLI